MILEFGSSRLAVEGRVLTVKCVLLVESPRLIGGTASSDATIGAARASGEETDEGVEERVGALDNLPVDCHDAETGVAIGIASVETPGLKVDEDAADVRAGTAVDDDLGSGTPAGIDIGADIPAEVDAGGATAAEVNIGSDTAAILGVGDEKADSGTGGGNIFVNRSFGFASETADVEASCMGVKGTGDVDAIGVGWEDRPSSSLWVVGVNATRELAGAVITSSAE